eukprot:1144213-Pelagomonas_calceolata.AAC.2
MTLLRQTCLPAAQVAFKSDYLRVFQAQQLSAAELLVAKEALAEARQVSAFLFAMRTSPEVELAKTGVSTMAKELPAVELLLHRRCWQRWSSAYCTPLGYTCTAHAGFL